MHLYTRVHTQNMHTNPPTHTFQKLLCQPCVWAVQPKAVSASLGSSVQTSPPDCSTRPKH